MNFLFVGRNIFDEGGKVHRMVYKCDSDLAQGSSYDFSLLFEYPDRPTDLRNIAMGDLDNDDKMDVIITQTAVVSTDDAIMDILESETPVSVESPEIATGFTLHQNYLEWLH